MYKYNHTWLVIGIYNLSHGQGLSVIIGKCERWRHIIYLSICCGFEYKLIVRHNISGDLLDINYNKYTDTKRQYLINEACISSSYFMRDDDTTKWLSFINTIGPGSNSAAFVLNIADCYNHMAYWGRKYSAYITNKSIHHLLKYDPSKTLTGVVFLDIAINLKKSGQILAVKYPKTSTLNGGENCISLFFSDVTNIPARKTLTIKTKEYFQYLDSDHSMDHLHSSFFN